MHWTATLFVSGIVLGFLYVCWQISQWKKRQKQYDDIETAHRMFEGCRGAASAGAKRGGRG